MMFYMAFVGLCDVQRSDGLRYFVIRRYREFYELQVDQSLLQVVCYSYFLSDLSFNLFTSLSLCIRPIASWPPDSFSAGLTQIVA